MPTKSEHRRKAEGKNISIRHDPMRDTTIDFKRREVEVDIKPVVRRPNPPYSSKKDGRGLDLGPLEKNSLLELVFDHINRDEYPRLTFASLSLWYKIRYSPARHNRGNYNPEFTGLCVHPRKVLRDFSNTYKDPPPGVTKITSVRHAYTLSIRDVVVVKGKDVIGGCDHNMVEKYRELALTDSLPRKVQSSYPAMREDQYIKQVEQLEGKKVSPINKECIKNLHRVASSLNGHQGSKTGTDDHPTTVVYHKSVKYNLYECCTDGVHYYHVEDAGCMVGISFCRDDTLLSTDEDDLPDNIRYWRNSASDIRWMCNLVLWKVLAINGNNGSWTNTDDLSAMLNLKSKQKLVPAPGCSVIRPHKPSRKLDPSHFAARAKKAKDQEELRKEALDIEREINWEKYCAERFNKVEYLLAVAKEPPDAKYVSQIVHAAAGGGPGEDLTRNNRQYDESYQKLIPEMMKRLEVRKPRPPPKNASDWHNKTTKFHTRNYPTASSVNHSAMPPLAQRKKHYENVRDRIFSEPEPVVVEPPQLIPIAPHHCGTSVEKISPPQIDIVEVADDNVSTISTLSANSSVITVDTSGVVKRRKRVSGKFREARKVKNLFSKLPRSESFVSDSPPKVNEGVVDHPLPHSKNEQHCAWDLETAGFEDSVCNSIMSHVKLEKMLPIAPPAPLLNIHDDLPCCCLPEEECFPENWHDCEPIILQIPPPPPLDAPIWRDVGEPDIEGEEAWVERPNKPGVLCCPPVHIPKPNEYIPQPKKYTIGNLEYDRPLLEKLYGADSQGYSKPYGTRRTWMKYFKFEQSTLDHLGISSYSDHTADSKMIQWMMREFISSKLLNSTRLLENWLAESTRQFPSATPEELNIAVVITYQQLTHLKRVRDMLLGPSALISSRISF